MSEQDIDKLGLSPDEKIIHEAKKRFHQAEEWESNARQNWLDDYKFANGDDINRYQWPSDIYNGRTTGMKPCLTQNMTRQHNLQIKNDARQNKPSIEVRPVSNGATAEAADVFEGIIRHIEYISDATQVYQTAVNFQVDAGMGYWRIVTDYCGDDSMDQEIFLRRVKDPLSIYLDPHINEADGSDARWGFVFEDMPRDQFDKEYPEAVDQVTKSTLEEGSGWQTEDTVRVAEYYRAVDVADTLITFLDINGQRQFIRKSQISDEEKDLHAMVMADPQSRSREITTRTIEWYKIAGSKIVERSTWPGKYVPIIRCYGEETIIDGKLDRFGHTRAMRDPQRMYNYWASSAVEQVALQTKSPWIASAESIEGHEKAWDNSNIDNPAVLTFNAKDDAGLPLPKPERSPPPVMATAYVQGMQIAGEQLQAVSGQYQAEMGAPGNEKSGAAINARQRQGDNATYHYIDHLGMAIKNTGKQFIDLIPKVYDTQRAMRILGEDGSDMHVELDPQAQQAHQAERDEKGEIVKMIFNPSVGVYDVQADIGPNYGTQRQEAFNAFQQIVSANHDLMPFIGDLMFKNADFPGADEMAERLHNMVPPQALNGQNPQIQQMQQHMQGIQAEAQQQQVQAQKVIDTLTQTVAKLQMDLKGKDQMRDIDAYNAETDRMRAIHEGLSDAHAAAATAVTAMAAAQAPAAGTPGNA